VHGNGDINNELVQLEYNEIRQQLEFERTQAARSYLDLFKADVRRRVVLGCSIQMWSQLTGMNGLFISLAPAGSERAKMTFFMFVVMVSSRICCNVLIGKITHGPISDVLHYLRLRICWCHWSSRQPRRFVRPIYIYFFSRTV
jgi:hypothetical protein